MPAQNKIVFPYIALEKAIGYVRKIYDKEPHNEMTADAVAQNMGYSGRSGSSNTTLSALNRYGLLSGRGDHIKISSDGFTILVDEYSDDQTQRTAALQRCLVNDSLFSKVNAKYPKIPSRNTLYSFLLKEGLDHSKAGLATDVYLESAEFVKNSTREYNEDSNPVDEDNTMPPAQETLSGKGLDLRLPLSNNITCILQTSHPLTDALWERMMKAFSAVKPDFSETTDNLDR